MDLECGNFTVIPEARLYFQYISGSAHVLACRIVAMCLSAVSTVITVIHLHTIIKWVSNVEIKMLLIVMCFVPTILGWMESGNYVFMYFQVGSIFSIIGACVPRALSACAVFILIYYARALVTLAEYITRLFGGMNEMEEELLKNKYKINVAAKPLCCLRCFHPINPTKKNLYRLMALISQNSFVRVLLLFVIIVSRSDSQGSKLVALSTVLNVITAISTMMATWGTSILTDLVKVPLSRYSIQRLSSLFTMSLLIFNFQGPIFQILANFRVFKCYLDFPRLMWADVWNRLLIVLEMLVLQIVASVTLAPRNNPVFDKHTAHSHADIQSSPNQSELAEIHPNSNGDSPSIVAVF